MLGPHVIDEVGKQQAHAVPDSEHRCKGRRPESDEKHHRDASPEPVAENLGQIEEASIAVRQREAPAMQQLGAHHQHRQHEEPVTA